MPRMLCSTPLLRRGALLIWGLWLRDGNVGSRLCGAASSTLHRVRDTMQLLTKRRGPNSGIDVGFSEIGTPGR